MKSKTLHENAKSSKENPRGQAFQALFCPQAYLPLKKPYKNSTSSKDVKSFFQFE
jgi:hypothetical protein